MELQIKPQYCPICGNVLHVNIHHKRQYVIDVILRTITNEEYRYICPKCGIVDIKN